MVKLSLVCAIVPGLLFHRHRTQIAEKHIGEDDDTAGNVSDTIGQGGENAR